MKGRKAVRKTYKQTVATIKIIASKGMNNGCEVSRGNRLSDSLKPPHVKATGMGEISNVTYPHVINYLRPTTRLLVKQNFPQLNYNHFGR